MSDAAKGRGEATAIYAALRRAGAGCPAFRKAMRQAAAKVEEAMRRVRGLVRCFVATSRR